MIITLLAQIAGKSVRICPQLFEITKSCQIESDTEIK